MTAVHRSGSEPACEVKRDERGRVWAAVVENVQLYRVNELCAIIRGYEAGADRSPVPEFTQLSPAQLWAWLLDAGEEERLERLGWLVEDAGRGLDCWRMMHADELGALRERRDYDHAEQAIREEALRGRHIR